MGEIYMYQDLNRAEFRADRIDMRAIPDVLLSKERRLQKLRNSIIYR